WAERVERRTAGEVRRGGCEDVAAVEGGRDDVAPERGVLDRNDGIRRRFVQDTTQHAVIGCNEEAAVDPGGEGAAFGPHAGVDHGHVHGPGRVEAPVTGEGEGRGIDVAGRD